MQTGMAQDMKNARKQLLEVVKNGKSALEKLVAMVAAREGDVGRFCIQSCCHRQRDFWSNIAGEGLCEGTACWSWGRWR